ncbi:beta-ketoacyl synthase N-terminal-like domain-containing protein [Micromonospora ureilytica]|uniref:beta-ketoacyl synthase N-terminal-like domain-containing protein n=1 Tax=Micromonospora ureilytica TaxID=709868 RepID=UPI0033E002E8
MGQRRVAVTGIGVVAPGGVGTKAFWERIVSGVPATRLITAFDPAPFRSRMAAECDFDPVQEGLDPSDAERLDRSTQLLAVAAGEALGDADFHIDPDGEHRVGVSVGTAVGCTQQLERQYLAVSDGGRTEWSTTGVPRRTMSRGAGMPRSSRRTSAASRVNRGSSRTRTSRSRTPSGVSRSTSGTARPIPRSST